MSAQALQPLDLDRLLAEQGTPSTKQEWKEFAQGLLTPQPCVFLRNLEISSLYARLYLRHPNYFKWAGMAAFASFHARVALWPMRLSSDATGFVDLESFSRHKALKTEDIEVIRQTNNAIFDDIFWAHLAYDCSPAGHERLGTLLPARSPGHSLFHGFGKLEAARKGSQERDPVAGESLIWQGNVDLLEHEQRAVVQGQFDRLSCSFARLFSMGSSLDFEVRHPLDKVRYFTSFYSFMLTRRLGQILRSGFLPRITYFDHRWSWILGSIVPRFRRFESDLERIEGRFQKIFHGVHTYQSCALR